LGRFIGSGLTSAGLSLESDGEKGKQRVSEIDPRLREYPAHPMIRNIGGPAAWLPRAKGLVLRANSL